MSLNRKKTIRTYVQESDKLQSKQSKRGGTNIWRWVAGFLTTAATLLGLYLALSPSISVRVGNNLNSFDPFQTTFILRNNYWFFTIRNTNLSYLGNQFVWSDGSEIHAREIRVPGAVIISIDPQKEYTFTLNMNFQFPARSVISAETSIEIVYHILIFTRHDSFRFKVFKNSSGAYEWSPIS